MARTAAHPIRVVLVEDYEIVRVALRTLLNQTGLIQVVGETTSAAVAIRDTPDWNPDVLLIDVFLADGSGLDVCRKIHLSCPSVRILFFSAFCDPSTLYEAVMGGASGYIQKTVLFKELTDAIELVAQGHSYFDQMSTNMLIHVLRSTPIQAAQGRLTCLSAQQNRVIRLMAEGKTNKEIAVVMGLSDKTVKNYLSDAYKKLRVTCRAAAAVALYQ